MNGGCSVARPREFDEAEVVQKATQLFWSQGYRATSPRDLLAATGLSRSSLYNTFGSKEGLFRRSMLAYVTGQAAFMRAELDRREARAGLEWMYEQLIAIGTPVADGGAGRSCMMCTAAIEADPQDTDLFEAVQAGRTAVTAVFRARLERAQGEGELPPGKDPAALAHFLFNTNMGLVVLARAGTPAETLRVIADQTLQAVFG
jgi:TetR/AcrR family transcriptional regulator, transcriptional repressor for nem operon